jgi:poly-gamma-glutamate synthase PgsB/CapB
VHLGFVFLLLAAYLVVERILHERRLGRIPIRVHVNGTRGKTSVTRLVAACLRRSGVRTLAKTTGGRACLVLPDGREEEIRRLGPASVLEQVKVVRRAASLRVEALVVECMALDPVLQEISERRMIRATVGVITNVRPDHLEVMGPSLDDVAKALAGTIPEEATLVTGEARYFADLSAVAAGRGSRAVLAEAPGPERPGADVPADLLENEAVARAVCRELGLDPAIVESCLDAERLARAAVPLPSLSRGGRTVHLLDAFGANDVESTRRLVDDALRRGAFPRPLVALFANRSDRPQRMRSFAAALAGEEVFALVGVIGDGARLASRRFRASVPRERLFRLSGGTAEELLEELLRVVPARSFTIVGMGNEKGAGTLFSAAFRGAGAR